MSRIATVIVSSVLAAPVTADELWRENPINAVGGYASQDARNPGGLGFWAETADNFTVPAGGRVIDVEFWGGYTSVQPGDTHGFTVRFYADINGNPGRVLSTQDVTAFTEVVYYTDPVLGFNGYHYTLRLFHPFTAIAGRTYWISIVAILDRGGTANEPQWGWAPATAAVAPNCQQWVSTPGAFTPQAGDAAFVLHGHGLCYANCDGSTTPPYLNINDFICFAAAFAAGDPYSNCDDSTRPILLNISDFVCFQSAFAAGCSAP
jgi:hypothetical protein